MLLEVWLYGTLRRYGGEAARESYAQLQVSLPEGSPLSDLLSCLNLPTEERGITFINGQLSAMPGLQPDLSHPLCEGDRIALFDLRSMWPFQYRHGVLMTERLGQAMETAKEDGLHTTYKG